MAYRMTPARKAALRKAQMASAKKRKRKRGRASKRTRAKAGVKIAAAALGAAGVTYAGKKVIRKKSENNMAIRTAMTKKLMAEARAKRKR